ncbi:MAG: CRISPR-associated endonuclease Cas3'' [Proteobacteria bacterium]|nr:CRISPR-associated endonuclease Cas3'' [Pseudomonadota bacterium]
MQLVWRDDVTPEALEADPKRLVALLETCPPASQEALSVPLYAAAAWLADAGLIEVADVDVPVEVPKIDGSRKVLRWAGAESEVVDATELKPNDTLVVPALYGGIRPAVGVWDPEATEPVEDRGDEAQWVQRGRAVLRVHRIPALMKAENEEELESALEDLTKEDGWRAEVATHLRRGRLWVDLPRDFAVLAGKRRRDANVDFIPGQETGSFLGRVVTLREHLAHVAQWARCFVDGLGLEPEIADDVVLAASLHDLGKADPRFQQILAGGDPVRAAQLNEPLAKSGMSPADRITQQRIQTRSGFPRGTRHELMSVALVEEIVRRQARDWELVLHLVGSHHGWCRPFAPPTVDPAPVLVEVEYEGTTLRGRSNHHLASVGSGVTERFWSLNRRYGVHGLAWLEAIVRLADHRGSERGGVR